MTINSNANQIIKFSALCSGVCYKLINNLEFGNLSIIFEINLISKKIPLSTCGYCRGKEILGENICTQQ